MILLLSSPLNIDNKRQVAHLQKLFAIFVEYPDLHELGLSRVMISAPDTSLIRETYKKAYQEFRKKADKRLYGFDI